MSDQMPEPIPVVRIVREAFAISWGMGPILFKALLPTSLILIAAQMLPSDGAEWGRYSLPVAAVLALGAPSLSAAALIVFAVTCHRLVLLGEGSVPEYGLKKWTSRETRFLGWGLLVGLSFGLGMLMVGIVVVPVAGAFLDFVAMPPTILGRILGVAIVLSALYVFARLSILLPATAVDEEPNLKWAWDVTDGNGWRFVLVVGILPLALELAPDLVLGYSVISDVLIRTVQCVLYAVEIAALSLSYRHLAGRHPESADKTAEIPATLTEATYRNS